jgi:hypothetical protein
LDYFDTLKLDYEASLLKWQEKSKGFFIHLSRDQPVTENDFSPACRQPHAHPSHVESCRADPLESDYGKRTQRNYGFLNR